MSKLRVFNGSGSYVIPHTAEADVRKYDKGITHIEPITEQSFPIGHVYDNMSKEDLQSEALKLELPKKKWQRMGEGKLRNYLKEQTA